MRQYGHTGGDVVGPLRRRPVLAPFDEVSVATERQYSGVRSEQVFTIDGSSAVPADPVTLAAIGLRERDHLQAWVLAHPEILGDDLMIITEEFDRWRTASGERDSDRLDVLAVDTDGRLVVAELKREKASDGVLNQVLNYGARVSRFSLDDLDEAYARYCAPATTPEEAAVQLREHAPTISDESLALGTRLVVLAAAYSDAVTNLALYLLSYGVPLTLLKFEVYRTDRGQLLLTTSQLLPVPEAEEFMVRPRSGVLTRNAAQVDRRAQRRLAVLLKRLDDGQPLTVIAPPGVRKVDVSAIEAWLQDDVHRGEALWHTDDDSQHPIEWNHTGQRYSIKGVAQALVHEATGEADAAVWGYNWLRHDGDGNNLAWHSDRSRESATDARSDDEDEPSV